MNKVIIIGSGFSSLSAACYMQKHGSKVTVLEKNEQIGGRASLLKEEGFTFDMGPSWYWMPDIFDRFFADFGKKTSDYYDLIRLDPAYRVYFDDAKIDIAGNTDDILDTFESIESGSRQKVADFLAKAKKNYDISMTDLVYQPGKSITELISWETAIRLNLFVKNISDEVDKVVKHPQLRHILKFPVLFLGSTPKNTPAFYNFMNHADFGLGTWYPKGGMHKVVLAMQSLAEELGVDFKVNHEVKSFITKENQVKGVVTDQGEFEADLVISGADYAHTEKLLDTEQRNYPTNYWKKKTFAPSSLLYYIGFNCKIPEVLHHNLFFDTDFNKHVKEIYETFEFPEKPLFYANFPSKTDVESAPEGMEAGFFLIPVAVDLKDNQEIHDKYLDLILDRLGDKINMDLKSHVIYKKSFGVKDFKNRYYSCRGNAYGLANTLLQTSVLRPGIQNKKLPNLFYTGQLTVPGPGVPPALISGKVVSDYIIKNNL